MDLRSAEVGESVAAAEYAKRLGIRNQSQSIDRRRARLCGMAKLAVGGCAAALAVFGIHQLVWLALSALLALAFVVLSVVHERVLARIKVRERTTEFYVTGLARLNGEWAGHGATGERYLDPAHVYARDLDLFGNASVFQYLCMARTRTGEDVLARWLLEPAENGEILRRQAAVRDLAGRLNFREALASAGEAVRKSVHPEALSGWGESDAILTSPARRVLTTTLGIVWIGGIILWIVTGSPFTVLVISLLNFAYAHSLHSRLNRAADGMERAADDLRLLAAILRLVEQEVFTAPLLVDAQAALKRDGIQPSLAVRRLARLSETIQSRHSLFARPLDMVTFWSAQLVFVAERWQREFGPLVRMWINTVGEVEALASLSAYSYEHPEYAFPEMVEEGPLFEADDMAHPLLTSAVANDVTLGRGAHLMILSGPNMAGKSTFIRSIGVNAILAQCGAPVCARRLRLSPLRVAASICILDSLHGGVSRFYAEIGRIKVIVDLAEGPVPVLFLLDELLSGTNSHDRFEGTRFVLQRLVEQNAVGIVSTHDLALTLIPDAMGGVGVSAHFEDRLEDEKLIFDYKLRPGVVETSNALKLMRAIGLGVSDE